MQITPYSEPEFDPYDDAVRVSGGEGWLAPTPGQPVEATLTLPGSKSLTNRELILAALSAEPSILRSPLWSRDTELMIDGLRALGTTIRKLPNSSRYGPDIAVEPADELVGSTTIECGLAGTVMRFLPPVAALALGPTTFDGDPHARTRPMSGVIQGLRRLGVDINDDARNALPFTLHGTGAVTGGAITIDASKSSQFVSGLLLAAARFTNGIDLTHSGSKLPSVPHIEMTIKALAERNVEVTSPEEGRWQVTPGQIGARDVDIEPDLSNAAPFLIAALVTGGSVCVTGWPSKTTQVGNQLLDFLPRFGATVSLAGDRLTVSGNGNGIHGVQLDLTAAGELAPNLVALAALADSQSIFSGIGHIRHHETDRIAALVAEINNLGGRVTELEDGLQVDPAPLHGGGWHAYADHRMATSAAIIGLAVPGVVVDDIDCTAKTLPQFPDLWNELTL